MEQLKGHSTLARKKCEFKNDINLFEGFTQGEKHKAIIKVAVKWGLIQIHITVNHIHCRYTDIFALIEFCMLSAGVHCSVVAEHNAHHACRACGPITNAPDEKVNT